jgi:hypothetical protein
MVLGFRKKPTGEEVVEPVEAQATPAAEEGKEVDTTGVAQTSGIDIVDEEIVEESLDQLRKFQKLHQWDLNLPISKLNAVDTALESDDLEKKVHVEHTLLEENSPYPEVAAAVRNYDE